LGSGTICIACQLEAFFSVEVAFTPTKNVNLELSLEGSEVLYLRVVVYIGRKAGNITEAKADVPSGFGMVKGITKGLFMRNS